MTKTLIVAAAVVGLAVAPFALMSYFAYTNSKVDASSRVYVEQNIPRMLAKWSNDELLKRVAPQFRQTVVDRQLDMLFDQCSEVGSLRSYVGFTGEAHISVKSREGEIVTALYVTDAKFENGRARVTIRLVQNQGQWQIMAFNVTPSMSVK
jgi:hypothetical protein